jgi:hypothetical protein
MEWSDSEEKKLPGSHVSRGAAYRRHNDGHLS